MAPKQSLLYFAFALVIVGCGGQSTPSNGSNSSGSSGGSNNAFELTLDPGTVETFAHDDRVSAGNAPSTDGHPDAMLTAHIRGTVTALILTICEDEQSQTSTQWDTVVGQDELPEGFVNRRGDQTWVLGVADSTGHLLNRGNGSMPETRFQPLTAVRLYFSLRDTVLAGRSVCLTAVRPDGPPAHAIAELR